MASHAQLRSTSPSTTSRMSCGPGLQLGLDGRVLLVAQAVAVDDRLHQLGPAAEVVVEGRRVALAGELVDVAQRHVEALAGEQVQHAARSSLSCVVSVASSRHRC